MMRGGILPQGCVSHGGSGAELEFVVPEMSVKSSKGVILDDAPQS